MDARRCYFVGCVVWGIINTGKPELLYDRFVFRERTNQRTREREDQLVIPQCRTELYRNSFICYAVRLWNNIPANIREVEMEWRFKKELYSFILRGGLERFRH